MLKLALLGKRNVVVCNLRYFLEPAVRPMRFREPDGGVAATPPADDVRTEVTLPGMTR
jgi:hypothetical protein